MKRKKKIYKYLLGIFMGNFDFNCMAFCFMMDGVLTHGGTGNLYGYI